MAIGKIYKKSVIIAKLLTESISFAFSQLRSDKLRTFLSLFGVSIGIFSIVAILTAIDSLKGVIMEGLKTFGSDAVIIQRFPMAGGEDEDGNAVMEVGEDGFKWWEYLKRPAVTAEDYAFLKENTRYSYAISFMVQLSAEVKYQRNSISGCGISCVAADWEKMTKVELSAGRYFSAEELSRGGNVAVIGSEVADELFGEGDPVGKRIKIGAKDAYVIGKFKEQGDELSLVDTDNSILVPLNFGKYMVNLREKNGAIVAKPAEGVSETDFQDELRNLMRSRRRLRPGDKNDFSVNKMTFLLSFVQNIFSSLNMAGWVIAGFSLLIGGFGIANIMFVSVKERTNMIGIQKALGAKKYVILTQFLTEAAFLAVTGGLIGILMVWLVVLAVPEDIGLTMRLSLSNILSGVAIASVIGVLSGFIPARIGAGLNPVDAINSK